MTASDSSRASAPIEAGLLHLWRTLAPLWSRVGSALRAGHRRILFVAPEHGCGTTTLAAASAIGLVENLERQILLAEINPFTPALAQDLALPPEPGWSTVRSGQASLPEALRATRKAGLTVLTGGSPLATQAGHLASAEARALLAEITSGERAVLLDSAPFLDHPEALVLLEYCDAAVVVVRARKSSKANALRTLRALEEARVPLLGIVLNRFVPDLPFGLLYGLQAGAGERRARA